MQFVIRSFLHNPVYFSLPEVQNFVQRLVLNLRDKPHYIPMKASGNIKVLF